MPKFVRRLKKVFIQCSMKTSKHYFAGINSKDGFLNKFNNINIEENGHVFILKGGPGTGKSTLMKNVGKYFEDNGEIVEYYQCSSDPESLDGIFLKSHKVSIVDGTAPHVCEASMIVAKEEIINLGTFISKKVKKYTNKIQKLLCAKQKEFTLAYKYIKSASNIYDINEYINEVKNNAAIVQNIIFEIPADESTHYTQKHLFLEAIDHDGIISLKDKNEYHRFVNLSFTQNENHDILYQLKTYYEQKHISHYIFYELLCPDKISGIYLVDEDILISQEITKRNSENKQNQKMIDKLILLAGKHIAKARYYHKKIEQIYVKNIDFNSINKITNNIIKEIEKYY